MRDAVAASYAAWQAGEHAEARDLARQAILLDEGVASIVARRVLVLALKELDEPAEALSELQQYLSFELVPKDRQWAEELETELRAALPDEPEPVPEPVTEPVTEPVVEPDPTPVDPTPAAKSGHPLLVIAAGGGFQQLGPWSYGAVAAEASIRLVNPLRLALGYQLGLGGSSCSATESSGCLAALSSVSLGPQLRFDGAVSPLATVALLAGFNGGVDPLVSPYAPVMIGFEAGGGLEFGPGPVGVRLRGLFRLLAPIGDGGAPHPGALISVDFVVRAGR